MRRNHWPLARHKIRARRRNGGDPIDRVVSVCAGNSPLERCPAAIGRWRPGQFVVVAHGIHTDVRNDSVGGWHVGLLQFKTLTAVLENAKKWPDDLNLA